MKQLALFAYLLYSLQFVTAQVFDMETIKYSGADDNRINLVILSEGYQTSELDQFITDATNYTNTMFSTSPFSEYTNYFNVYAIKVPSNESGADDPSENVYVDTYFNATFDAFGNSYLLYYEIDGNNANNTESKIYNVLADNFPAYDQALILVNTDDYGGSGGLFPMAYSGYWGANVIMHELGHSLFDLKDEYYPGDELAGEAINMTQENDANLIKWKNWVGTNDVGVYQYECSKCDTDNYTNWYKPHQNCIMESISQSFCSVCKEGMIKKIHSLISPIDSYIPVSNSVTNPTFPLEVQLNLVTPTPNTLESTWTLNASNFANNVNSVSILDIDLNEGLNSLTVAIHDATAMLRVDNQEHFYITTVTWSIDNSQLGIEDIKSSTDRFNISISPNPANRLIHMTYESTLNSPLYVKLSSIDGKYIQFYNLLHNLTTPIAINHLKQGIYIASFYSGTTLIANKRIVKY